MLIFFAVNLNWHSELQLNSENHLKTGNWLLVGLFYDGCSGSTKAILGNRGSWFTAWYSIIDGNEQQQCVEFVENTLTRNSDGQFVAKLPFKVSPVELGNSYYRAKKQLQAFTTRYDEKTQQLYRNFICKSISTLSMSGIDENLNSVKQYFMPHRVMLRPDSLTTECQRVSVYNKWVVAK